MNRDPRNPSPGADASGPPSDTRKEAVPALRLPHALGAAVAASVLLLTGLPTVAAAAAPGDVAWTVQTVDGEGGAGRGSFAYDLDPGQSVSDAMRVVNTGTVALPLDVYAADAFTTATGEVDLVEGGAPSSDMGLWVSVSAPQLTLQPGEQADVAFTIAVPADAAPGDHAAGLVTSLVSQDDSQTLSVDRRLGTRVNVRVSGELRPDAVIENVRTTYIPSWNPFEAGTLTVDYAVRNAGNTRLTGIDTVAAAGPAGLLTTVTPGQQLPEIIPRSVIDVRRELQVVSLGWVSGSVVVAPEAVGLGAELLAPVTVGYSAVAVPWSLLVLLALVIGVAVGTVVFVRRRRGMEPAAGAAATV